MMTLSNGKAVFAQTVDSRLWVPNDRVYTVVPHGNRIYMGGEFTYVGPSTGYGAAIDINTGKLTVVDRGE